ncbi:hypothetical protein LCGC14_1823250, partial [marine sediment metagenome]
IIVLDRNRDIKKELLFNINFFYLKSFKKKRFFTFSYINEPFFRGTVIFGLDFKNKMRPLNLSKIEKDGTVIPVDPLLFKRFLLSEKNKFIAFSSQTPIDDTSPVREMLNNFRFEKDKIINLTICNSCLERHKFTLLNENLKIKSYKNQIICAECAYDIVLRRIKFAGLISQEKISLKLKNFFTHMILKFKDVKKVLSAFQVNFDPYKNRDITLYDIEKAPPVSSKYINQNFENINIPTSFKRVLSGLKLSAMLPIQSMAIQNGLLTKRSNLLVMAPTSGGKTLVGELAGISRVLNEKDAKMLYLVPIVALANIRTEEFKKKYKTLKLRIIKRIGESLFEKKEEDNLQDLINADIIIATYEAIDYILRSGHKELLGNIGTIIIDEIQTLTFSDAPDAGSFELVFGAETTVPILFSEADIDVENALNNLSGLSAVSVSGDFSTGFVITFAGADGETTHPALTISNNTLEITSSPITIDVEETVKGFPPFVDTLFQAEETGPTVANTGSLTAIETPQGGVTQLTNPQDAEIGSNIETDAELKQRRKELLQRSGTATVEGIRNALLDVVDVNQALVIENTALIVDAGGRPGKSFESVVEGGADQDIADAIWASKPAGIETFGSVSVPVVDSQGFIHTINFSRATEIDIWMIVNITPNTDPAEGPLYPIDGDQQVEDVVLAFAQDFRIGQDVVVNQFFTPINTIGGVIGIEILVGTSPAPTMSDNIAIDVTERAVFDSARITVNS